MPRSAGNLGRRSLLAIGALLVTSGCGAAAAGAVAGQSGSKPSQPPSSSASASAPTTSTGAPSSTTQTAPTSTHAAPLKVASWRPGAHAGGVTPIVIRFSQPLSASAVHDVSLSPSVPGTWTLSGGTTMRFVPKGAYAPFSKVSVTVKSAVASAAGAHLRRPLRFSFSVGAPSSTRLEQLLAMQGYLPLRFHAAHRLSHTVAADQAALFAPPAGRLLWDPGWPATLHVLWAHDPSLVIRGAVMAFESWHNMTMDGVAGPAVWTALEQAQEKGKRSPVAYSYAIASESSPESLTVWHAGHQVLHSLANTGIPAAPTALGTYPVYERLQNQVMQGTNPDGSHYADPVSWVAYFNGGDAVHYFPRASFGYPQSLGCVELPYAAAQTAWGYLTYGTLVTVAP